MLIAMITMPIMFSNVLVASLARILPIDWAAAGGSGGVLGFWLGSRLREVRQLEQQEQLKG